jgi:hypothetical protein
MSDSTNPTVPGQASPGSNRFTLDWRDLPASEVTGAEVLAVFGDYQARVEGPHDSIGGHWPDPGQWIIGRSGPDPTNYPAEVIAQGPAPTQAQGQLAVETVLSSLAGAPNPASAARYLQNHPLFTAALMSTVDPQNVLTDNGDPLLDPAIGDEYLAKHPAFAARVVAHARDLAERYGLMLPGSVVVPADFAGSFTLDGPQDPDAPLQIGDHVVLATATTHPYDVGRGEMCPVYYASDAGVITDLADNATRAAVAFADDTHAVVEVGDLRFHYREDPLGDRDQRAVRPGGAAALHHRSERHDGLDTPSSPSGMVIPPGGPMFRQTVPPSGVTAQASSRVALPAFPSTDAGFGR